MKKAGFIAVIIALLSATFSIAESEKYISKKVVLGTYKFRGLGSFNMPWSYVKKHEIDVDDNHKIYVLD